MIRNLNPILESLADQANQDPSWTPWSQMRGLQLRDLIIDALNDNSLEWPMNFGHLTKSQWIKYMIQHPDFYMQQTNDSSVFRAHERLLLDLASKLLKRKICFISLFPEDKDETFEPPMPTSSRPYYLLGCNKAFLDNFYVSIFKNEWNYPETNGRNNNDTDLKCVVQMDDTGETYGNILTNHTKNTNTNVF